ncbi:MAG: CHAP domain-containing protein [Clostridiales bacterium]|nr:CHAP domain-containing protein [Candidatus Crickella equi]
MKETAMKRIKNTVLASLLALTLVATAPLACFAEGEAVVPQNTQQDRIIAHAMEHQGQKFKKISDRNKGIKIDYGKAWCAWFIEHCSYQCKLGSIIPSKSKSNFAVGPLSRDLVNNKKATITFVNKKMWNKRKGDYNKSRRSYDKNYKPKKGDIVVYANYQVTGSYWFSHIGFVYEDCENALKGVKTIEGNTMATNEKKWEKTSIVGVRSNADDKNKERRIAAYITPNYCKHKNVDPETGICKNSKCKAYIGVEENDDINSTNS